LHLHSKVRVPMCKVRSSREIVARRVPILAVKARW
jgi:hypothetical protein